GLTVLGGGQIPAAGLLEFAALLQDRPQVQRGPAVSPRGGLAVPLLGLLGRHRPVLVGVPRGPAVQCAGQSVCPFPVPTLGRGPEPALGPVRVPTMFQQVGQGVGAECVALLGGLAQPVLGGGLVTTLPVMATERVRRRGGAGDGGDPPPSGGLLGVAPLVQQDAEVVGGDAVARRGGGTQTGFGSVEI